MVFLLHPISLMKRDGFNHLIRPVSKPHYYSGVRAHLLSWKLDVISVIKYANKRHDLEGPCSGANARFSLLYSRIVHPIHSPVYWNPRTVTCRVFNFLLYGARFFLKYKYRYRYHTSTYQSSKNDILPLGTFTYAPSTHHILVVWYIT